MSDSRSWDPVLPYLDRSSATYILVDLRGYGRSKELTGSYDLPEAVADVLAVADEVGFREFDIVCHSMSGLIAQRVAQVASNRVTGLFGVSPIPPQGFRMDAGALAELLRVIEDEAAAIEAISVRTGYRYGNGWTRARVGAMKSGCSPHAMAGYARMIASTQLASGMQESALPVEVLCGAHDIEALRYGPAKKAFNAVYADARLTELHDAGHFAMLEMPVFLAALLEQFAGRS